MTIMLVIPTLVELKPEYYYIYKVSMGFLLNARSPRLQRKPLSNKQRKGGPIYKAVNLTII